MRGQLHDRVCSQWISPAVLDPILWRAGAMSALSLALSNLRANVILIVLGFHSMLAYLVWIPFAAATDFARPPCAWRSFPIIDSHRFFGFDLFCAYRTST